MSDFFAGVCFTLASEFIALILVWICGGDK